jgi:transposase
MMDIVGGVRVTTEYGVFLGLDVGKSDHHAVALDPSGKRLHDAALPNTEAGLRKLFDKLGRHGRILAVVDQPASIGVLPVAVARACGHQIAYLPGLVMRRLADLHPGTAKTDARDAWVIADAARTLPHTLRRVDAGDDALAELEMLVGYDDDLAGEVTRISNRIRGLLTLSVLLVERQRRPHPVCDEARGHKVVPAGPRSHARQPAGHQRHTRRGTAISRAAGGHRRGTAGTFGACRP